MPYKTYWVTWFLLLIVTVGMLAAGSGSLTGRLLLGLLLAAMVVKIGLIGGNFMHLRSEKRSLILIVALGILLVGLALFAGIAPDALRVLKLSGHS
ncbi:MAG: cytochrome C oxidase subunit IV family protein [Acidobacteria bacterium]|nr:cytochrome C oxidase subunit IV family protein [Acidobacteriota bacterium]MBI3470998.1 cytochrome C oxidase subunit IV family protein [Candidatus Solibacter usitatus]